MSAELADSLDPVSRLDSIARGLSDPAKTALRPVQLIGMPAAPVLAVDRYLLDLSRELAVRRLDPSRFASIDESRAGNVLSTIDVILAVFGPFRRQVVDAARAALDQATPVFELVLELPLIAGEAALLLGDLLAQLAEYQKGRRGLLTRPLTEVPACVFAWFLDTVVDQLSGGEGAPYTGPASLPEEPPLPKLERRGVQSVLRDAVRDSQSFPLALEAPRAARRFVSERLDDWGLADHAARAALPVSELVTNVVVHAQTQAVVEVMAARGKARVGVRDFSNDPLEPRPGDAGAPFGRGLRIVDQSVSRWGVERLATGKTVWFELDAPDPATPKAANGQR